GGGHEHRVALGAVRAAAACEPGGDDAVPALRHREHGRVLEAADELGGGAQVRMGFGGLREEDAVVLVQRLPAVLALEGEVHAVGDVGVVGLLLGGGGAVVGGQRQIGRASCRDRACGGEVKVCG